MRLGVNPDRGPMEPLPEGITCWGFQARQHPCPRPCSHSLSAGWVALMCLATQSKQQDHSPGWGGVTAPSWAAWSPLLSLTYLAWRWGIARRAYCPCSL